MQTFAVNTHFRKMMCLLAFCGWGLSLSVSSCTPKPKNLRTVKFKQKTTKHVAQRKPEPMSHSKAMW
jgi:hypothetical protein